MFFARRQFGMALAASLAVASGAKAVPLPDDRTTPGNAMPAQSADPINVQVEAAPSRPTEEFQVQDIQFVGEQDGVPEQVLKDRLVAYFSTSTDILRAYLVRVRYAPGSDISVGLALRADRAHAAAIVEKASRIFAGWSNSGNHLDIIFLDDDHEGRLRLVCHPFFHRGVTE